MFGRTRPRADTQALGAGAETGAQRYLESRGLKTVERNYRCRGGEIDLIMRDERALVFVEVRLRRHRGFGSAAESVTRKKQARIILAAQHYLTYARSSAACRFDVVSYDGHNNGQPEWIKNAFFAD